MVDTAELIRVRSEERARYRRTLDTFLRAFAEETFTDLAAVAIVTVERQRCARIVANMKNQRQAFREIVDDPEAQLPKVPNDWFAPFFHTERPDEPGTVLVDRYLRPNGTTIKDFAAACGISRRHASYVANGHAKITAALAVRFARVLGTTTLYWLNLQAQVDAYDEEYRWNIR